MVQTPVIVQGREAFVRREWRDAFELMSVADRESSLEPVDLERFAAAAYLIGEDDDATAIWTRLHQDLIGEGRIERAARWGF